MAAGAVSRLDRLIDPLDAARRAVFVALMRVPLLGPLLASRDRRLLAQTCLGVATTFTLTLLAPGVLFVVGPALFGVAHVAGDVRYLLSRREVPRAWAFVALAASLSLVACRAAETALPGALPYARLEMMLGLGWVLAGGTTGALGEGRPARVLLVAPAVLLAMVEAAARPELARALFAYGHNLIGIALWALLFRRRLVFALPALALAASLALALASGEALSWVRLEGAWASRLVDEALWAATPTLSQRAAVGLGVSFVFLQSIHYAVWLSWVPQEDLPSEGTTSFKMSLRSFRRDLGDAGFLLMVAAAAAVIGASFVSVHRTRYLYLSLATFHGYLELACAAFLVGRGRLGGARGLRGAWPPPGSGPSCSRPPSSCPSCSI